MPFDICIVSGSTRPRLQSAINHRLYAELHSTDYRFETGLVSKTGKSAFYLKIAALLRVLPMYDWVLWIDDDAFFTDFQYDIRRIIQDVPAETWLVLADGRVRPGGAFTLVNSGVMLMRRSDAAFDFLSAVFALDPSVVRSWWQDDVHGMYTKTEQDAIIYALDQLIAPTAFRVLPHTQLNAREYHFSARLDEHFICHFPGVPERPAAVRRFGERFGVGPTLIPRALLSEYGLSGDMEDEGVALKRASVLRRAVRRVRAFVASPRAS